MKYVDIIFWVALAGAGVANSFADWYGFTARANEAWKKYKYPMEPAPLTLYYKLTGLAFKEKFFLSGTILVFLTDKFHFAQFCQICLTVIAIYFRPEIFNLLTLLWVFILWGAATHTSYIIITHKNR